MTTQQTGVYFGGIDLAAPVAESFTGQYFGEDYYFDFDNRTVTRLTTNEVHSIRQWKTNRIIFEVFKL